MKRYLYRGSKKNEILFPLGGIGAGNISISGTGRLLDWEIFNRPNKGSFNGFSSFFVKAENKEEVIDARVLNSDLPPPYTGKQIPNVEFREYGYGPDRHLLTGVPHFKDNTFFGCFPMSELDFIDPTFPGKVSLEAFSPFIPQDDFNSSLPAAFFTVNLQNTMKEELDYSVVLALNNPFPAPRVNHAPEGRFKTMVLEGSKETSLPNEVGQLAMSCKGEEMSWQQYWYHGNWFDNIAMFWRDLNTPGHFKNRIYENQQPKSKTEDVAVLAAHAKILPGERKQFHFLITWYVPMYWNYWKHPEKAPKDKAWKNYYATQFEDVMHLSTYCMEQWNSLQERTQKFVDTLQSSTLPPVALEAMTSNLSVLKSPTCLRLTNGEFYGWEGCHASSGSCEGSCTHVWNYTFALPFLFPKLERSMREVDYKYNLRPDGGMPFRVQLPLGSERSRFRPCVDGQMGGVIKTFRDWKISGDNKWLKGIWPSVKKSLEFAWSKDNADLWDPERIGVISGRQHHTLDMELFGPNAWLELFYLGALKAGSLMAQALGEDDSARFYQSLYAAGRKYTEEHLFNGRYFIQKIDIKDRTTLQPYEEGDTLTGGSTIETYWNNETNEVKYQVDQGCHIDQVLAQWMADLCGVGEIVSPDMVLSALRSIYKNNFLKSFRDHFNPCRIYALNDESGALICTWPKGTRRPSVPIPYAEESMHGFEYQAAIHMIMCGLEKEGMDIVSSIRDRYDGEKRNPYNEFECGSNYARSMASWALLNAYSGFKYDLTKDMIGFLPLKQGGEHQYFFSVGECWGQYVATEFETSITTVEGELILSKLQIPDVRNVDFIELGGQRIDFSIMEDEILLPSVKIVPDAKLTIKYRKGV